MFDINNLEACGHFLIVELNKVDDESVSAGGIVLATGSDSRKSEQRGTSWATIRNVGSNAWVGHYDPKGEWKPWAEEGDKVMLAQYAGQAFPIPDKGISKEDQELLGRLRLIKDDDVLIVDRGES